MEPLFETIVLVMTNLTAPEVGWISTPLPGIDPEKPDEPFQKKFCTTQLDTARLLPELKTIPLKPTFAPSRIKPFSVMASLDPALMVMPLAPPATVIPEKPWP